MSRPTSNGTSAASTAGRSWSWTIRGWTSERTEHERRVRAYFADRPDDLLVIDISAGEGWEALCPFLGVPVPDKPFPRRG